MLESVPKWIISSIADHFDKRRDDLFMHVEGTKRKDPTTSSWFELRFNGPDRELIGKDRYRFTITINCAVISLLDEQDAYSIHSASGKVAKAFTSSIPIYKFGKEDTDDSSLVDCMNVRGKILTNVYGQENPSDDNTLAEVQGDYEFELTITGE